MIIDRVFLNRFLLLVTGTLLLVTCFSACGTTYPKKSLTESVQKLFKKELDVEVQTQLVGKTLYVSFQIDDLVTKDIELPKEATSKLENAMLSVSRIALSTDAEIDYTVIHARDASWKVQTTLIRKMQDLKDLFYWRISKTDFDERIILEINRESAKNPMAGEQPEWRDLTLPDFMGRWVASRISLGTKVNPFLNVLLGIEKISAHYDQDSKNLRLTVNNYSRFSSTGASSISLELLKSSIREQMSKVEKKYLTARKGQPAVDLDWARKVVVENPAGETIFEIQREEWLKIQKSKNVLGPQSVVYG